MNALPTEWRPLTVEALSGELNGFDSWVLAGGYSVARITGKDTRMHGDMDIGVFRSDLEACLAALGRGRVFLCLEGKHVAWVGGPVPAAVHDIWITDRAGKFWVLQVMVYDDEGDRVIYRRDRRISWAKRDHAIEVGGMRVLNPFVTVLFKTNKAQMEDKEVHDVMALIAYAARGQGHITR
ncbi:MAG: hypothetical protein JSS11_07305 [Verrucomicrobia bacterium]|nr:hypothetical protein [Verrucomicrobiota bacterium]